ncbi:hypothetical protein ACFE04_025897 [Oxalis oulophora]
METTPHILLVVFPTQGHINPALQLAKRLVRLGLQVTFATSNYATKHMDNSLQGLSYATFSDGHGQGFKPDQDSNKFMEVVAEYGSQDLRKLLNELNMEQDRRLTCIIYSVLLPWVGKIALDLGIPSMLFWDQPATLLDIYYYYVKGYRDAILDSVKDVPNLSLVKLPNLPPFANSDLPSFFTLGSPHSYILKIVEEHFKILDEEKNPKILVNSFDALELEAMTAIKEYSVVGIGPLISSSYLDGKEPAGGDLLKTSKTYIHWLATKSESSVIYIAFGSMSVLSTDQLEEMAGALLNTGRPFLWIIRDEDQRERLTRKEELEKQGMIIPWCSQVEVLSHRATGCFVTHCGWNSTFESLVSGVPMVGVPQWSDQGTNAKLFQDVWKVGIRVEKNEDGIVECNEIERCLELVMKSEEMKRNAKKWKELAREAVKESGTSDTNLRDFVDQVRKIGGY